MRNLQGDLGCFSETRYSATGVEMKTTVRQMKPRNGSFGVYACLRTRACVCVHVRVSADGQAAARGRSFCLSL